MSLADKMFEKLGFQKLSENEYTLQYLESVCSNQFIPIRLEFQKPYRHIIIYRGTDERPVILRYEEILACAQAIKKMEE